MTDSPSSAFLLDTNVFIEAYRRYYAMDLCPGFWECLEHYCQEARLLSIDRVRALHEESGTQDRWENAKYAARQYLEFSTTELDRQWAWNKLAELCQRTGDFSGEIHALVERCQLSNASLRSMSYAAGRLLTVNSEQYGVWDKEEKRVMVQNLISLMEAHTEQMHPNDLVRLAYLYLIVGEGEQAQRITSLGLQKDPDNYHVKKLASRPFYTSVRRHHE